MSVWCFSRLSALEPDGFVVGKWNGQILTIK